MTADTRLVEDLIIGAGAILLQAGDELAAGANRFASADLTSAALLAHEIGLEAFTLVEQVRSYALRVEVQQ